VFVNSPDTQLIQVYSPYQCLRRKRSIESRSIPRSSQDRGCPSTQGGTLQDLTPKSIGLIANNQADQALSSSFIPGVFRYCKQLGAGDEVCYKVYCEVSCSGLRCP
jgi:hypothetical protein